MTSSAQPTARALAAVYLTALRSGDVSDTTITQDVYDALDGLDADEDELRIAARAIAPETSAWVAENAAHTGEPPAPRSEPETKEIGLGITVDMRTARLVLDTPGRGTAGFYRAEGWPRGGSRVRQEYVWLETNGDPTIVPHADYPEALADVLADAGVTRAQFEAALGVSWDHWCT